MSRDGPALAGKGGRLPYDALPDSSDGPWMVAATIAINLLALALPLLMLQVFDRILPHAALDTLTLLVLGTGVAILAEAGLRMMRASVMAWSAARFEHGAMSDAVSRLLATPPERVAAGGYADRFRAISGLREYFSGQTFLQMLDLPFTFVYLGVVALIGGWMVAVPVAGVAMFALLSYRFGKRHAELFRERNEADRRRSNFLVETLSGIHTVKSMAMEAFMLRRYERLQEACARLTMRLASAMDMSSGVGGLFAPIMTVLAVSAGAALVVSGEMTNGELGACIMLILRSLGPLQRAGGIIIGHQQVRSLHEEILPLFASPGLSERPTQRPLADMPGRIELRDATFSAGANGPVLVEDISLVFEPGECVLIRGANGSGRSTLLQLIAGLLRPSSGEVLLDGVRLADLDPGYVRSMIAYVPENAQAFQGTILENVTGFDPDRADRALEIARALGLDTYVTRLPRGWESPIGDSAADSTPVGHRQRIAMVRALCTGARVVLFDAANISMDAEGDAALRRFLQTAKGRTTLVMVTHRPSLAKLAERILTMEAGRLVETVDPVVWEEAPLPESGFDGATPAEGPPSVPLSRGTDDDSRWQDTRRAVQLGFSSASDLGLCLSELLRALRWRGDPRDVAEALPYYEDTLDISGLLNCMAQLGYRSAESRLSLADLDKRMLPCLFVPSRGSALVVLLRRASGFLVYDPGIATMRDESNLSLQGDAHFFSKEQLENGVEAGWVRRVIGRMRPVVAQALVSALIYGLVLLPVPLFVMGVYTAVMPSGSLLNLAYFAAGALVAIAVGGIFIIHRARILAYVAGRLDYVFGTAVFKQILSLPPSMSESAAIGSQVARLGSFEAFRDMFVGPFASTLLELPSVLALVIALGIINPVGLLIVGLALLLFVLLYVILQPQVDRAVAEFARRATRRHEFLVETIGKLRAIREFGGEAIWAERFREISATATMAGYRVARIGAALNAGGYLVTMICTLAILVVSVVFAASGTYGIGVVIASMMLGWRILGPVQTGFMNLTRLDRVRNAAQQMDRLMMLRGERVIGPSPYATRRFRGRVEFERVSFRYSLETDPALIGATFNIRPGMLVAVTGPNGGGKSTLLKLLAGLYQPQAGSLRIDNIDLRQMDPVDLRRAIGYVPQESSLFRGTIAQNLRLVRPAATDDELNHALALAGALNDIALLPKGIGTRVGDSATERLPASLRQKISLARAYLTQAPILLFDEPANTLDREGDRWFLEAMRKLKGRSTIFLVTHRPSHIRAADLAVVLQGGYVRDVAPPAEALGRLGIGA